MKNFVLKTSTVIGVVTLLFIFMVGCSKEQMPGPSGDVQSNEIGLRKGAPSPGTQSIAQIAIDGGFTELVAALSYVDDSLNTGLVDLFLNGKDQYTVFAPTNKAFQDLYTALGVSKVSDLSPTLVRDVLLYHVVEGRRASNSVVPKVGTKTISTLLTVTFSVDTKGVITAVSNSANITTANISASNGIIHVIDAVILPI